MNTVTVTSLAASGVTKTFAGNVALDDVSIEVRPGEVHGLVGGNGSGKSTLIKILAGVYHADPGGEIRVGDRVIAADRVTPEWAHEAGLRFVHQDPAIVPALTVGENMMLGSRFPSWGHVGIRWREVYKRTQGLLDRYEMDISARTPAADLDPAQRTMVAMARAFVDGSVLGARHQDEGILILDEPTASLTATDFGHLLEAMRRVASTGTGIVYVSHRPGEVVEICDRVTALRDGRIAGEVAGEDLDEDTVIELMVGRALELHAKRADEVHSGGEVVLEARGVSSGARVRGVDLTVHRGEIVGIAGLVGCGGTELLEVLFGARRRHAGEILVDGRPVRLRTVSDAIAAGIAYVPEDRAAHAAFADMTVRENLAAAGVGRRMGGLRLSHADERAQSALLIDRYGIVTTSDSQLLSRLSGGNQQKVMLARWLRREPRILLLDEPTQGVDVNARANIYDAIRAAVDAGTSVIVASSDDDELAVLCDRVVVMYQGRVTAELSAPLDADHLAELVVRPGEQEDAA